MDPKDTPDPILDFAAVEDEDLRAGKLPDPEINADAPEDQPDERERNPDGTFKGKDDEGKKPEAKKPEGGDGKKPDEEIKHGKRDDTVPLAKFMEEKNKLKAELEQRDITIKQFAEKLAALEAKLPKPEAPEEPDYIDDPKAYVDHKVAEALARIAEANKKVEEEGKQAKETATAAVEQVEVQRFLTDLQAHEARFVQQNPDYHEALAHIRQIRAFQLKEFEPEITDAQMIDVIRREEIGLARELAQKGRDPVAFAYDLAKRYGYQPKAKDAPKGNGGGQPPPGGKTQLPPDQSLGGGGGAPDLKDDEPEQDAVDIALATLLKRRA